MKKILLLCLLAINVFGQIQSGPMIGFTEMNEVLVWVQTKKAQKVKIKYNDLKNPSQSFFSEEVKTEKVNGFSTKIVLEELTPGANYNYEVYLNNKKQNFAYPTTFKTQALWQFRTDPPNFKVAVGSCIYIAQAETDRPGRAYGGEYEIFKSIANQKPDMMIWGGDNTYYREMDFNSKSGMIRRMTHSRSLPEMQELLANTSNYAIWDDHDYGANDADRSFWMKREALDVFKTFWGNPNYIFDNEAITGTTTFNDVQFFFVDDRWWKAPNDRLATGNRDYLGTKQMEWLIDALRTSSASFKVIVNGGQVINSDKVFENMSNYANERNYLIDAITKEKIAGVVFVSGDRHHTVAHKLDREGTYPLYDFTVSPITSGPAKPLKSEYETKTIIPETVVEGKRNFGIMEFSGKFKERVMKMTILDKDGKEIWSKELKSGDLK
jgi:alkaline phosphatase D